MRLLLTRFLFVLFIVGLWASNGMPASAAPQADAVDDRQASFMPPPEALLAIPSPSPPVENGAPIPLAASAPAPTPKPKAIETKPLAPVDPDSLGLLSPTEGGLGANLWEGTPRGFVERLLSEIELPGASPTLNNLARRLLLSVAAVPQGKSQGGPGLTTLRLDKLIAMGNVDEAWKMAQMAKGQQMDEPTLRTLTEAALIAPPADKDDHAVCDRIPDMMAANAAKEETATAWQKSLLLCQYRAGDIDAVNLGLDLMREQKDKDDLFLSLMGHNLIGGAKVLPRQLTPFTPVTLAIFRHADLPLPRTLYAKPSAMLIPEMLKARAEDEMARLNLAERAATQNLIEPSSLIAVYKSLKYTPEALAAPDRASENGAKLRALLVQSLDTPNLPPATRVDRMARFFGSLEPGQQTGAMVRLVADELKGITPNTEVTVYSATMARALVHAGRPSDALGWIKLAKESGAAIGSVQTAMHESWPLFALAGLVPDADYAAGLNAWLDAVLPTVEPGKTPTAAQRESRQKASVVLAILASAGFAVSEDTTMRVLDPGALAVPVKRRLMLPSPLLLERLRSAGTQNRKGEAILLSLALGNDGASETPPSVVADITRALRQVGLAADAQNLAIEALAGLLPPVVTTPTVMPEAVIAPPSTKP